VDEPKPSKTQRKKAMHALQDLGAALVELSPAQLAGIELPEGLIDAIEHARRISGFEARRRQLQYIGKLMRAVDAGPIAERVAALERPQQRQSHEHQLAERWRDRLLADDSALGELSRSYPGIDITHVRTLIRNARKEQAEQRAPHALRELFREVRSLVQLRQVIDGAADSAD
jgi:ribosome-associated protein